MQVNGIADFGMRSADFSLPRYAPFNPQSALRNPKL